MDTLACFNQALLQDDFVSSLSYESTPLQVLCRWSIVEESLDHGVVRPTQTSLSESSRRISPWYPWAHAILLSKVQENEGANLLDLRNGILPASR